MEAQKQTILEYAEIILGIESDALLEYCVEATIDRFLSYTNRLQLEEDSQIPTELERILADAVSRMYRQTKKAQEGIDYAVQSIEDNGQKISYGDAQSSNFNSDDASIFSDSIKLINSYCLPIVIQDIDEDSTIYD